MKEQGWWGHIRSSVWFLLNFIGIQEEILSKPPDQALGNSHFNLCTSNSNISLQ